MNEQQFKLLVRQFAVVQSRVWSLVASYGDDATKEAQGPRKAMLRQLRQMQLETSKFEGMLDEAQQQVQFLINLQDQATSSTPKNPA